MIDEIPDAVYAKYQTENSLRENTSVS